MTNNSKKDILLRLFSDNTVGNITASTMRQFISDIFDDKEVVIKKFKTLDLFEAQDNLEVYEGSLVAITEDTPENSGLYISLVNQPRERNLIKRFSNNISIVSEKRGNYEYKASQGQNVFACNYTEDLVDVYVDGKKIRKSQVVANTGTSITLLSPLNKNQEVEIITTIKES